MLKACCVAFLALVVIAAVPSERSHAQSDFGRVFGTVVDPFGKPAEQMSVTLAGSAPDREQSTRTDDRGRFSFSNVPAGNYWLVTPATDVLRNNEVAVSAGAELRLDVQLQQDQTVIELAICRDCRSDAAAPRRALQQPRDDLSAAVMSAAEPEEGWERFNQRTFAYPAELRTAGVRGTVVIQGTVDAEGATRDIVVVSSSDERLTSHALRTISPLRWTPAMIHSTPVDSPLRVTMEYSLRGFQ